MPNLAPLIHQGEAHWKEHLPKKYARLTANGTLQKELAKAANPTRKEHDQLVEAGLTYDGAWEAVRGQHLILPAAAVE